MDLILSDDGLRITRAVRSSVTFESLISTALQGNRADLVGAWKMHEVIEYAATEEGVGFRVKEGGLFLTCEDPIFVIATFAALIQGLVYKRDHAHDRARLLPHHRPATPDQLTETRPIPFTSVIN